MLSFHFHKNLTDIEYTSVGHIAPYVSFNCDRGWTDRKPLFEAPLPQDWEESGEVFQQILPVDDHWWKSFQDTKLDSLIALAVDRNYSVAWQSTV